MGGGHSCVCMVRVGLEQSEVVISEEELGCWVVEVSGCCVFLPREPEVVRGYDRGHASLSSCLFPVHSLYIWDMDLSYCGKNPPQCISESLNHKTFQ